MVTRENPFPYVVNALTDLPEEFQRAVQSCLGDEESINSILVLPSQPFMKRGGIPRQALLSTTHGILHVRDAKPPLADYLPAESLLYVHHKLILLYGCLELAGEVRGELVRITAEYNAIGQYLLDAALRQFLQLSYGTAAPGPGMRKQNDNLLEELGKESFKFMNGLRLYALQPGERLLGYAFQPRITERFLRYFSRPVAPASMFALTDQAVVFIEEDKARGASHGWVITICPRNVILTVESKRMQSWDKLSVLSLRNKVSLERNLILEHDTVLACKSLWSNQISQESEKQ